MFVKQREAMIFYRAERLGSAAGSRSGAIRWNRWLGAKYFFREIG
jgi:hypothetical protein